MWFWKKSSSIVLWSILSSDLDLDRVGDTTRSDIIRRRTRGPSGLNRPYISGPRRGRARGERRRERRTQSARALAQCFRCESEGGRERGRRRRQVCRKKRRSSIFSEEKVRRRITIITAQKGECTLLADSQWRLGDLSTSSQPLQTELLSNFRNHVGQPIYLFQEITSVATFSQLFWDPLRGNFMQSPGSALLNQDKRANLFDLLIPKKVSKSFN